MPGLEIEVVRVQGKCDAGLRPGDRFEASGPHITALGHDRVCQVALASVVLNAGRATLPESGGSICVSCMDPGTGDGGNVIFRVAAEPEPVPSSRVIFFQPVEIRGTCPAGLRTGRRFTVQGMSLLRTAGDDSGACLASMAHWLPSLWQLESGRRFFAHASCPGCTMGRAFPATAPAAAGPEPPENRVVFLGGHADKWELCQAISKYRRVSRVAGENESARALRREAMERQNRGDFEGACQCMVRAVAELGSGER